jgi:hypothetical protein
MVEITLSGVGTPGMTASVAPVDGRLPGGPNFSLAPVPGGDPEGSIQLRRLSATTVDVGTRGVDGKRYLQAVFEVRNADLGGNAYGSPRTNLTFVPVGTASAIQGTPVSRFLKQDGTPAAPELALELRPTGAVALDGGGGLISQYPDVLQVFTEHEIGGLVAPAAVTERFPYGFVVRHASSTSTRTLPGNPSPSEFDGRVTFAYRLDLQPNPADDPFTISVFALAVDDGETRITQSVEEQSGAALAAFETRAASLSVAGVSLLAGGSYSGSAATRVVCSVRTGGSSVAPSAFLQPPGTTLEVGEVTLLSAAQAAAFCVQGGDVSTEYTLMPVNLSQSASTSLSVTGMNIAGVMGPPSPSLMPSFSHHGATSDQDAPARESFRTTLREWERANLQSRRSTGSGSVGRTLASSDVLPHAITPGVPAVGDLMNLNVAQGCVGALDQRTGRVRSIGDHVIIVADTMNPAGGFTTAQYDSIRTEIDTIAFPVVAGSFGSPSDIDANGRVVAFFSRAVNELSPPASSSTTVAYTAARDLQDPTTCPRSNNGEMVYFMVPDPTGVVNGNVRTLSFVRGQTVPMFGRELQTLISASRRTVLLGAPLEEAWLDEGLSRIASELMFYRLSLGLSPGANIALADLTTGANASRRVAAFNAYVNANFGSFRPWLQRPDTSGAYKKNATLASGGALWAFLRYAADRAGGDQSSFWAALSDGPATGMDNLQAALGIDPDEWVRDFVVATYADDAVPGLAPKHRQPSWNFRSVYGGLGGYPLQVRPLTNGTPMTLSYSHGGGASFIRFAVPANQGATVSIAAGGAPPPPSTSFALIRTK